MTVPKTGTKSITCVEDAKAFQGDAAIYCHVFDAMWEQSYDFSQYADAPVVAVVQADDRLRQYDYLLSQRVTVKKVFAGSDIAEGDQIEILDYGFASNYLGLAFHSMTNILKPGREYLVFLSHLSEYSKYIGIAYYEPDVYGPWAFVVGEENTPLLELDSNVITVPYQDVKEYMYFVAISEFYERIREIREQCMEYYKLK